MGAFVLPNKEIPDAVDLRSFIAPGKLACVLFLAISDK
jgi:hypothetical protein